MKLASEVQPQKKNINRVFKDKKLVPSEEKDNENGLLLTNASGAVFWSNTAFLKQTNFENSEVVNSALVDLIA